MENLELFEAYNDGREVVLSSRQNRAITFTVLGGRIKDLINDSGVMFPYSVGQQYTRSIETWCCNNGFKMDGKSCCPEEKVFGMRKKDIPMGHEIQVRPKSGLALKEGLTVLNTPGTVDSGYDGEIKVIVYNTNPQSYQIKKGQKIAQAVLCPVINGKFVTLHEVIELNEKERGSNGFGSSGI